MTEPGVLLLSVIVGLQFVMILTCWGLNWMTRRQINEMYQRQYELRAQLRQSEEDFQRVINECNDLTVWISSNGQDPLKQRVRKQE